MKDTLTRNDFVKAFNQSNKNKNTAISFSSWDNLRTNSEKGFATFKANENVWSSHPERSKSELVSIWKSALGGKFFSDISIDSFRGSTYEITIRGCKFNLMNR